MKLTITTDKNEENVNVTGNICGNYSLSDIKPIATGMARMLIELVKASDATNLLKGTVLYSAQRIINEELDKECKTYALNLSTKG